MNVKMKKAPRNRESFANERNSLNKQQLHLNFLVLFIFLGGDLTINTLRC